MNSLLLASLIFVLSAPICLAREVSLHGRHAVMIDADDPAFADPAYDDSGWERIAVPSSLRAAGIDGRADVFWYRITFALPPDWSGGSPAIRLGVITRSDETYLNGVRIGGIGKVGRWHSDWHAYAPTAPRLYPFDQTLLRPGERNVLAIRGAREPYIDDGGIIVGPVALVALPHALGEFLALQGRFVSFRYLFFGIETMIFMGFVVAVILGIRSRFLVLFGLFYIPSYIFSLERRGIAALFGLEGEVTQFVATCCGALALPAFIEFIAHVLQRPVGLFARTIQVLSALTLVSVPNTDVAALQWWAIESNLVWHTLMLVGLLTITAWTAYAIRQHAPYAKAIGVGLLALFTGVFVDIVSPVNVLEREFGFRIGEVGILFLYLSLAFVVMRDIVDREAGLRAANAHITQVHEEERARMARDLHDGIGQWLTTIKIKLDLLTGRDKETSASVRQKLDALATDVVGAIEDVRRVSHDLAPTLLEQRGLIGAMNAHAERANVVGLVEVGVEAPDEVSLEPAVATHVFRIYQEALANALRHSGCTRIAVAIEQSKTHFRMVVSDDGQGFDTTQTQAEFALGLASMRSRAKLLQAFFDVRSDVGSGVTLTLVVPHTPLMDAS